jgi:AMP-polyphosphate phosphotransferase
MLEKIDLDQAIDKSDYRERMVALQPKLGLLQRRAHELGIPLIVVFEGWGAAGKGTLINNLILSMDPRGFNVYSTRPPTEEERMRPFLWRFWTRTPEKGRIALFDRSWYGRVLGERVEKAVKKSALAGAYDDINAFERQLVSGGTVIVKFFLHISKKEQKKRFEKLEENEYTAWKVTADDWRHHKEYDEYAEAIEEMLAATDTAPAPWTIVEAHDERFATVKTFSAVADALERAVAAATGKTGGDRKPLPPKTKTEALSRSVLDNSDLALAVGREEYEEKLKKYQAKIWDLEHAAYQKRLPVVVVFEGWDAAGKGGTIRRLVQGMDPRGYEVVPFAAPNDVEKRHHYLWRFWNKLPKAGHLNIFDRSWYGRVLVERVEGFCSESEWQRAYQEINETEKQWADSGMAVIKFWLHISRDEQLRRFNARQKDPDKQWKITAEDWRNREKWESYKAAIDEMLLRTDTPHTPWTVVEANSKQYARIKVLKTVIKAMEQAL